MLACGWDLSWGWNTEHVASPCGLGFLTTWWPGSKDECSERESQVQAVSPFVTKPSRSCTDFRHSLFPAAVTNGHQGTRKRVLKPPYSLCSVDTECPCSVPCAFLGPVPLIGVGCRDCPGLGQTSIPGSNTHVQGEGRV